jgi:dTDP-glucose 4,6-dehydratase
MDKSMTRKILVTGGAGFIGSALIRYLIKNTPHQILNFDKLTYAGNLKSLEEVEKNPHYKFIQGDINNREEIDLVINSFNPTSIIHLAAESHVDRSISSPADFLRTNIIGTFNLLEVALQYWIQAGSPSTFHFQHVSTDEVYGSVETELFDEEAKYNPSSPYSASKAASDHLVRAWGKTYGLPFIITNSSNNYGPWQNDEKLIPLMILNALAAKPLVLYGDGHQVRDWLYVEDHVKALWLIHEKGLKGETYNVGGESERTNIQVVDKICNILDKIYSRKSHRYQISHIADRPGHDQRYAIDCSKLKNQLGWQKEESFESGLDKTVKWYVNKLNN